MTLCMCTLLTVDECSCTYECTVVVKNNYIHVHYIVYPIMRGRIKGTAGYVLCAVACCGTIIMITSKGHTFTMQYVYMQCSSIYLNGHNILAFINR